MDSTGYFGSTVYEAPLDIRLGFLRRTYAHLLGASILFVLASTGLYMSGVSASIADLVMGNGRGGWLLVLGGFMLLSWLSTAMTRVDNRVTNYAGLVLFTLLEAVIFAPMIFIAAKTAPGVLPSATIVTLLGFGGLSLYALTTKQDFSYLRPILIIGACTAFGMIICGALFGFDLGVWFSGLMILFSMASILYTTSRVLHQYRADQHVAAALELFSALALMLWYVLRLFLQTSRR